MATQPHDPEAEARDLRAELARLEEDMRRVQGFGADVEKVSPLDKFRPREPHPPPEDSPKQRAELRQIGERMRDVQAQLRELEAGTPLERESTAESAARDGIAGTMSATLDGLAASATGAIGKDGPIDHPILAVEGRFAHMSELLGATLGNGSNAFSNSTRAALMRACLAPVGETADGRPVIGPASVMRACLAIGAKELSPEQPPFTLGQAIAAHFVAILSGGEPAREKLLALVPDEQTGEATSAALADPELTRALADAARLVPQLTPGNTRVDIRHAILALLRTPQAQRVILDNRVPSNEPIFGSLFQSVRAHLQARINEDEARGSGAALDSESALASIMSTLKYDSAAAPPPPERQSELHFVADKPADRLEDDRLGVADEARALAEVICLRDPGPPLAIGLFGDWGSGKSTFMNMIEAAIGELTGRVKDDAEAGRRFVTKVVSLKFNAWHYNDANLWASLTSEFFSQLRLGGHGARAGANYKALVNEVAKRVARLEGEAASEAESAVSARKEADSLKIELEGLESRRGTIAAKALAGTVQSMLSQVSKGELTRIRDAMDGLGHSLDLPKDKQDDPDALRTALDRRSDEVSTEIMRAAELPGRIEGFGRALARALTFGDIKTAALLYGALLLAAAAVIGFEALPLDQLQASIAKLAASGATVVTFAFGLRQVYRVVEPIFRAADHFATRLRTERETLEKDIAAKQDALAAAQKKLAEAEAERARKEAEAARFRGGRPEQVLDYFLNISDETKRFEGELGTISRVRRAFEQLNAICEQGKSDLDRIVLYIDDLDRCQVHQVVKVLEAVHLLLAFPLFVVVVGVDSRWLQNSLLKFYEKQLRSSGETADEAIDRATVQDYLEKIFQIPVRLRPLGNVADGDFRRYLDSVAGPVRATEITVEVEVAPEGDATESEAGGTQLTPVEAVLKPAPETARQTLERITLRQDELDMIEALSPFLGKSPRAVKRFMNIYRLIRGLHRGADLDAFLDGGEDNPASYPAVQFWLALETGMAPRAAAQFSQYLDALEKGGFPLREGVLALFRDAARDGLRSDRRLSPTGKDALMKLLQAVPPAELARYEPALMALVKALPGNDGTTRLNAARAETLRFTLRHT